jgi:hypothetical protein
MSWKPALTPNMQFNDLTVVAEHGRANGERTYLCLCKCGNQTIVMGSNLTRNHTKSCGCFKSRTTSERAKIDKRTHGRSPSCMATPDPTYASWQAMRTRCLNPKAANYNRYGGMGVKISPRWESFENFLEDMGERPPKRSLDRIDAFGDYGPENCRWATASEQSSNQRRTTDRARWAALLEQSKANE